MRHLNQETALPLPADAHVETLLEERVTTTAALVARAQAGDTAAFGQLYRGHVDRVFAVCLRMVADRGRAEELTQRAFVKAWQALGSFRGESAFGSWLHRIAVNVVLVEMRSARRRQQRIQTTDDLTCYDCPGGGAAPGERLDLEEAIASLPEQARAVLVLHEIEGFKHDEIAEMLEIAPGTSKAHLHRARKLLMERLNR